MQRSKEFRKGQLAWEINKEGHAQGMSSITPKGPSLRSWGARYSLYSSTSGSCAPAPPNMGPLGQLRICPKVFKIDKLGIL